MKKHSFVWGMAVCALALAGCGGRVKAVSVSELAAYLAKLPVNTDARPATVGIVNANISTEWRKINSVVAEGGRYVILDLSSCFADKNAIGDGMNIIQNNKLIKGIILPATLTIIWPNAFYDCNSLTSVTIPEGVTSIGWDAFSKCSSLTSVTFQGGGIEKFDARAFPHDDVLWSAYQAGGAGTYTLRGNSWTKR
jgi:hypothetical protein